MVEIGVPKKPVRSKKLANTQQEKRMILSNPFEKNEILNIGNELTNCRDKFK